MRNKEHNQLDSGSASRLSSIIPFGYLMNNSPIFCVNLLATMNGIKRYFGVLPISFRNALIATIVIAILMSLKTYLLIAAKPYPVDEDFKRKAIFIFPILNYSIWLLMSPLLFRFMRRINDMSLKAIRRNTLYLALGLSISLAHEFIALTVYNGALYIKYLLSESNVFALDVESGLLGLSKTFVEYWVIGFILLHFYTKKKFQKSELRNIQLESNLVKAQMSALKNQLHPHFLFNSFNTISSLMEEDIPLAQRMIAKLGMLLRKILKDGDVQLITLDEEVELSKLYLEVEQIRFKGRLVTRYAIDPSIKSILVPTLLLQPAVENAVKHGFYNKTGECEISIKAFQEEEYIIIEILDNGGGSQNNDSFSFGLGLNNMKQRLIASYGTKHELNIGSKTQKEGFVVQIKIREEAIQK